MEASGGYERPLIEALVIRDIAYSRVNPRQAREFARATGRLAKTDRVDARMLCQMGEALKLTPDRPNDPEREHLAALMARRDDLVSMRAAEKNRLAQARIASVVTDIKTHINLLTRRIDKLEAAIEDHIRDHANLTDLQAILISAPGVGKIIAAQLIAGLPELGTLDRRAIAALAGLAPHACGSGQMRGKRRCWGGRAHIRKALYQAAFIASRFDPYLKACRQTMTDKGKPFKVIIIALARKLLIRLNSIVKRGQKYQTNPSF